MRYLVNKNRTTYPTTITTAYRTTSSHSKLWMW